MKKLFTSESVTEGHPDKLCDQVSDAVLDAILAQDPNAHVACECAAKTGFLMIFGEASGNFDVDYEAIARKVICDIGYDNEEACFDGNTCRIIVHMEEQSAMILQEGKPWIRLSLITRRIRAYGVIPSMPAAG